MSPILVRISFRLSKVMSPSLCPFKIEKLYKICSSCVIVNIILAYPLHYLAISARNSPGSIVPLLSASHSLMIFYIYYWLDTHCISLINCPTSCVRFACTSGDSFPSPSLSSWLKASKMCFLCSSLNWLAIFNIIKVHQLKKMTEIRDVWTISGKYQGGSKFDILLQHLHIRFQQPLHAFLEIFRLILH